MNQVLLQCGGEPKLGLGMDFIQSVMRSYSIQALEKGRLVSLVLKRSSCPLYSRGRLLSEGTHCHRHLKFECTNFLLFPRDHLWLQNRSS